MEVVWERFYEVFFEFMVVNGYKFFLIICDRNIFDVCVNKVKEIVEKVNIKYKIVCFELDVVVDEYVFGKVLFEIE